MSKLEWVAAPWDVTVLRPHASAPPPFTRPPCPAGEVWDESAKRCRPPHQAPHVPHPSAPPPFVPPRSRVSGTALEWDDYAPLPFTNPPEMVWDDCVVTQEVVKDIATLGLTIPPAINEVHAKGILVLWNAQHQVLGDYGSQDVVPGWTQRDGIVLHGFAQWWSGTPKLYPKNDTADSSGVVVANLTPDHLNALDQWAAGQAQQIPGATIIDAAASKALLALWGKTDGVQSGALPDYGMQAADLSPTWTARDTSMLKLFSQWWNAGGKPTVSTSGTLDAGNSNALKQWFAEQLANVPAGWAAPGQQPKTTPAAQTCKEGEVWDDVNKACQPLPTGITVSGEPPPSSSTKKWLIVGGVVLAGGLLAWLAVRGSGGVAAGAPAPVGENPVEIWSAPKTKRERRQKLRDVALTSMYASGGPSLLRAYGILDGWRIEERVSGVEYLELKEMLSEIGPDRRRTREMNANPSGYYVKVRGGNNEKYGPYPTLQRAKTFARIGAQNGKHDRVVLHGGRVVRHYRAGTGESLVH